MRKASSGDTSYTRSLLEKGAAKIGEKIREEAGELSRTRSRGRATRAWSRRPRT
ncbi:MAG: hypothetical protein SangKO_072270 [Sandaracinaceae bacterium]